MQMRIWLAIREIYQATIKAVECLDHQLAQLYEQIVKKMNGTLYITADHGNAELKFDEKSGQPKYGTYHTIKFRLFGSKMTYMIRKQIGTQGLAMWLRSF